MSSLPLLHSFFLSHDHHHHPLSFLFFVMYSLVIVVRTTVFPVSTLFLLQFFSLITHLLIISCHDLSVSSFYLSFSLFFAKLCAGCQTRFFVQSTLWTLSQRIYRLSLFFSCFLYIYFSGVKEEGSDDVVVCLDSENEDEAEITLFLWSRKRKRSFFL